MKQRKLFAILTLVAFMMTLLPMAAFAATAVTPAVDLSVAAGVEGNVGAITVTAAEAGNLVLTAPNGVKFTNVTTSNEIDLTDVATTATVSAPTYAAQQITIPVTVAGDVVIKGVDVESSIAGVYNLQISGTGLSATNAAKITVTAATESRFASQVSIDKTSTQIGVNNKAKVTVYVFDAFNNPVSGKEVFIASDREGTDIISSTNTGAGPASNPYVYKAKTGTDGKVEFSVYSNIVGKAKLAVGLVDDDTSSPKKSVYEYVIGNKDHTASAVELIGTVDLTYTAGSANAVSVLSTTVTGTNRANNVDNTEISFRVTAGGAPVANQEVTFSVDRSGATLNKTTAKTDAAGVVKVKVYAEKADTYTVEAKVGSKSAEHKVTFVAAGSYDLALDSAATELIAKDQEYTIKVKVLDGNGNRIKTDATADVFFEDLSKPSGASVNILKGWNATDNLVTGKFTPTHEGQYKIKVYLDNGKNAVVTLDVKEQGDIVRMEASYPQTTITLGMQTNKPTVKLYDANNVMTKVENFSGFTFVASDALKGTFDADKRFTATKEQKYAGSFTITVIDTSNKLTAVIPMTIAAPASAIALELDGDAVVNTAAKVKVKVLNTQGDVIALGEDGNPSFENYYVISKPEGATVTVDKGTDFEKNLKEKGVANFNVYSTQNGDVTIQFVVKAKVYDEATKVQNDRVFTAPITVNFGAPKAEVPGANKVTLFIGQQVAVVDGDASVLDVAPFIKDGRTFVPVRFIAEALGADVKYDAATQTVTATRGDDVVVLTIGSNVMTVNGEAQVTDVAPFIVDGRTVLPFRALAEAFGSEVAWDAATQSVVFEK